MDSQMQIVANRLKRAPVDLEAIFADLGITYHERSLAYGQSGWIERIGDKFNIVVNADEPEVRRRFTAAHELAHYLLHRDLMEDGAKMNRHVDSLFGVEEAEHDGPFKPHHEVQANKLAAQIIMPAGMVREKKNAGASSAAIATDLGVSKAAMDIRLSTLGL